MNYIVDKTVGSGKAAFALLVIVTLAVFGSRAAGLPDPNNGVLINHSQVSPGLARQIADLPSLEDAGEKVATDGKPISDQHAYLVLPLLFKTDNTEDRLNTKNNSCRETNTSSIHEREKCFVLTSPSLICTHLGRRFTLVGAKPSGTG